MTYTCPLCGQQHDTTACPTHSLSIQQRFGISAPIGTTCNGCCHEQLAARDAEIKELQKTLGEYRERQTTHDFEVAELKKSWNNLREEVLEQQQRAERAEAQVAELRKDAERWHEVKRRFDAQKTSAAAIDAAIKESKR